MSAGNVFRLGISIPPGHGHPWVYRASDGWTTRFKMCQENTLLLFSTISLTAFIASSSLHHLAPQEGSCQLIFAMYVKYWWPMTVHESSFSSVFFTVITKSWFGTAQQFGGQVHASQKNSLKILSALPGDNWYCQKYRKQMSSLLHRYRGRTPPWADHPSRQNCIFRAGL